MPYILVRHKVADYAKWKPVFDEHGAARKASGSKGGHLFRSADNPNEVIILLQWDDLGKARQFAQTQDLRQTMERAGVIDQPDVYFVDEVEKPSV
ncbi:MAG: cyclase [Bacteroidota bacterium]